MIQTETLSNTEKTKLPNGWCWTELKEIARVFAGSSAPQGKEYFDSVGPPFIRVSDLSNKKRTICLLEAADHLSNKALKECSLVLAKSGSTLFPKSGAAILANNRALLGMDAYIVSHLMAVEPIDKVVDSLWIYWAICQIDMLDYSDNPSYPSLKQSTAEKITIPLPPLQEQKRIIGIIREKMLSIEKTKAATEEQLVAAKALPTAYLLKVFNSSEAQKWQHKRFDYITSERLIGLVRSGLEQDEKRKYPYIKMNNITMDGRLDLSDLVKVNATNEEVKRYELCKGDFLFNTRNSFELVGKTAIFDIEAQNWVFNNNIMRIRFREGINSTFILMAFHSPYVRSQLQAFKSNTTNVCAIYDHQLRDIKLPIPNLQDQNGIVNNYNSLMVKARLLENKLDEQLNIVNKLPLALLRQAFNGEL